MQRLQQKAVSYLLSSVGSIADIDPNDISASLYNGNIQLNNITLRPKKLNELIFGHKEDENKAINKTDISESKTEENVRSKFHDAFEVEIYEGIAQTIELSVPLPNLKTSMPIRVTMDGVTLSLRRRRRPKLRTTNADDEFPDFDPLKYEEVLEGLKEELVLGLAPFRVSDTHSATTSIGSHVKMKTKAYERRGTEGGDCSSSSDDGVADTDIETVNHGAEGESDTEKGNSDWDAVGFDSCSDGEELNENVEGRSGGWMTYLKSAGMSMIPEGWKAPRTYIIDLKNIKVVLDCTSHSLSSTHKDKTSKISQQPNSAKQLTEKQPSFMLSIQIASLQVILEPHSTSPSPFSQKNLAQVTVSNVRRFNFGEITLSVHVPPSITEASSPCRDSANSHNTTTGAAIESQIPDENIITFLRIPPFEVTTNKTETSPNNLSSIVNKGILNKSIRTEMSIAQKELIHVTLSERVVYYVQCCFLGILGNNETPMDAVGATGSINISKDRWARCIAMTLREVKDRRKRYNLSVEFLRERYGVRERYCDLLGRLIDGREVGQFEAYRDELAGLEMDLRYRDVVFALRRAVHKAKGTVALLDNGVSSVLQSLAAKRAAEEEGNKLDKSSISGVGTTVVTLQEPGPMTVSLAGVTILLPGGVSVCLEKVKYMLIENISRSIRVENLEVSINKHTREGSEYVKESSRSHTYITTILVQSPIRSSISSSTQDAIGAANDQKDQRPFFLYEEVYEQVNNTNNRKYQKLQPLSHQVKEGKLNVDGTNASATTVSFNLPLGKRCSSGHVSSDTVAAIYASKVITVGALVIGVTPSLLVSVMVHPVKALVNIQKAVDKMDYRRRAASRFASAGMSIIDPSVIATVVGMKERQMFFPTSRPLREIDSNLSNIDSKNSNTQLVEVTNFTVNMSSIVLQMGCLKLALNGLTLRAITSSGSRGLLYDVNMTGLWVGVITSLTTAPDTGYPVCSKGQGSLPNDDVRTSTPTKDFNTDTKVITLLRPLDLFTDRAHNTIVATAIYLDFPIDGLLAIQAMWGSMSDFRELVQTLGHICQPSSQRRVLEEEAAGLTRRAAARRLRASSKDDGSISGNAFTGDYSDYDDASNSVYEMSNSSFCSRGSRLGGASTTAAYSSRKVYNSAVKRGTKIRGMLFEVLNRSRRPSKNCIEGLNLIRQLSVYHRLTASRRPPQIIFPIVHLSHEKVVKVRITTISISFEERYRPRGHPSDSYDPSLVNVPNRGRTVNKSTLFYLGNVDMLLFGGTTSVEMDKTYLEVVDTIPAPVIQIMVHKVLLNMRVVTNSTLNRSKSLNKERVEEGARTAPCATPPFDACSFLEIKTMRLAACDGHMDFTADNMNVCGKGISIKNTKFTIVPNPGVSKVDFRPTAASNLNASLRVNALDLRFLQGPRFEPIIPIMYDHVVPLARALMTPLDIRLFMSSLTDVVVSLEEGSISITSFNGFMMLGVLFGGGAGSSVISHSSQISKIIPNTIPLSLVPTRQQKKSRQIQNDDNCPTSDIWHDNLTRLTEHMISVHERKVAGTIPTTTHRGSEKYSTSVPMTKQSAMPRNGESVNGCANESTISFLPRVSMLNDCDTMMRTIKIENVTLSLCSPKTPECALHVRIDSFSKTDPIEKEEYWTSCPPAASNASVMSCPYISVAFVSCSNNIPKTYSPIINATKSSSMATDVYPHTTLFPTHESVEGNAMRDHGGILTSTSLGDIFPIDSKRYALLVARYVINESEKSVTDLAVVSPGSRAALGVDYIFQFQRATGIISDPDGFHLEQKQNQERANAADLYGARDYVEDDFFQEGGEGSNRRGLNDQSPSPRGLSSLSSDERFAAIDEVITRKKKPQYPLTTTTNTITVEDILFQVSVTTSAELQAVRGCVDFITAACGDHRKNIVIVSSYLPLQSWLEMISSRRKPQRRNYRRSGASTSVFVPGKFTMTNDPTTTTADKWCGDYTWNQDSSNTNTYTRDNNSNVSELEHHIINDSATTIGASAASEEVSHVVIRGEVYDLSVATLSIQSTLSVTESDIVRRSQMREMLNEYHDDSDYCEMKCFCDGSANEADHANDDSRNHHFNNVTGRVILFEGCTFIERPKQHRITSVVVHPNTHVVFKNCIFALPDGCRLNELEMGVCEPSATSVVVYDDCRWTLENPVSIGKDGRTISKSDLFRESALEDSASSVSPRDDSDVFGDGRDDYTSTKITNSSFLSLTRDRFILKIISIKGAATLLASASHQLILESAGIHWHSTTDITRDRQSIATLLASMERGSHNDMDANIQGGTAGSIYVSNSRIISNNVNLDGAFSPNRTINDVEGVSIFPKPVIVVKSAIHTVVELESLNVSCIFFDKLCDVVPNATIAVNIDQSRMFGTWQGSEDLENPDGITMEEEEQVEEKENVQKINKNKMNTNESNEYAHENDSITNDIVEDDFSLNLFSNKKVSISGISKIGTVSLHWPLIDAMMILSREFSDDGVEPDRIISNDIFLNKKEHCYHSNHVNHIKHFSKTAILRPVVSSIDLHNNELHRHHSAKLGGATGPRCTNTTSSVRENPKRIDSKRIMTFVPTTESIGDLSVRYTIPEFSVIILLPTGCPMSRVIISDVKIDTESSVSSKKRQMVEKYIALHKNRSCLSRCNSTSTSNFILGVPSSAATSDPSHCDTFNPASSISSDNNDRISGHFNVPHGGSLTGNTRGEDRLLLNVSAKGSIYIYNPCEKHWTTVIDSSIISVRGVRTPNWASLLVTLKGIDVMISSPTLRTISFIQTYLGQHREMYAMNQQYCSKLESQLNRTMSVNSSVSNVSVAAQLSTDTTTKFTQRPMTQIKSSPLHSILNEVGLPIEVTFTDHHAYRLPAGGSLRRPKPFNFHLMSISVAGMAAVHIKPFRNVTRSRYTDSPGNLEVVEASIPKSGSGSGLTKEDLLIPIVFSNEDENVLFAQRSVTYIGDGIELSIERTFTSLFSEEIRIRTCCIVENHTPYHFVFSGSPSFQTNDNVSQKMVSGFPPPPLTEMDKYIPNDTEPTVLEKLNEIISTTSTPDKVHVTTDTTTSLNYGPRPNVPLFSIAPHSRMGFPHWVIDNPLIAVSMERYVPSVSSSDIQNLSITPRGEAAKHQHSTRVPLCKSLRSLSQEVVDNNYATKFITSQFEFTSVANECTPSVVSSLISDSSNSPSPTPTGDLAPKVNVFATLALGVNPKTHISTLHLHNSCCGMKNWMRFGLSVAYYKTKGSSNQILCREPLGPGEICCPRNYCEAETTTAILEVQTPLGLYCTDYVPLSPSHLSDKPMTYTLRRQRRQGGYSAAVRNFTSGASGVNVSGGFLNAGTSFLASWFSGSDLSPSNSTLAPTEHDKRHNYRVDDTYDVNKDDYNPELDIVQLLLIPGAHASQPVLHIIPHESYGYLTNRTGETIQLKRDDGDIVIPGIGGAPFPPYTTIYVPLTSYCISPAISSGLLSFCVPPADSKKDAPTAIGRGGPILSDTTHFTNVDGFPFPLSGITQQNDSRYHGDSLPTPPIFSSTSTKRFLLDQSTNIAIVSCPLPPSSFSFQRHSYIIQKQEGPFVSSPLMSPYTTVPNDSDAVNEHACNPFHKTINAFEIMPLFAISNSDPSRLLVVGHRARSKTSNMAGKVEYLAVEPMRTIGYCRTAEYARYEDEFQVAFGKWKCDSVDSEGREKIATPNTAPVTQNCGLSSREPSLTSIDLLTTFSAYIPVSAYKEEYTMVPVMLIPSLPTQSNPQEKEKKENSHSLPSDRGEDRTSSYLADYGINGSNGNYHTSHRGKLMFHTVRVLKPTISYITELIVDSEGPPPLTVINATQCDFREIKGLSIGYYPDGGSGATRRLFHQIPTKDEQGERRVVSACSALIYDSSGPLALKAATPGEILVDDAFLMGCGRAAAVTYGKQRLELDKEKDDEGDIEWGGVSHSGLIGNGEMDLHPIEAVGYGYTGDQNVDVTDSKHTYPGSMKRSNILYTVKAFNCDDHVRRFLLVLHSPSAILFQDQKKDTHKVAAVSVPSKATVGGVVTDSCSYLTFDWCNNLSDSNGGCGVRDREDMSTGRNTSPAVQLLSSETFQIYFKVQDLSCWLLDYEKKNMLSHHPSSDSHTTTSGQRAASLLKNGGNSMIKPHAAAKDKSTHIYSGTDSLAHSSPITDNGKQTTSHTHIVPIIQIVVGSISMMLKFVSDSYRSGEAVENVPPTVTNQSQWSSSTTSSGSLSLPYSQSRLPFLFSSTSIFECNVNNLAIIDHISGCGTLSSKGGDSYSSISNTVTNEDDQIKRLSTQSFALLPCSFNVSVVGRDPLVEHNQLNAISINTSVSHIEIHITDKLLIAVGEFTDNSSWPGSGTGNMKKTMTESHRQACEAQQSLSNLLKEQSERGHTLTPTIAIPDTATILSTILPIPTNGDLRIKYLSAETIVLGEVQMTVSWKRSEGADVLESIPLLSRLLLSIDRASIVLPAFKKLHFQEESIGVLLSSVQSHYQRALLNQWASILGGVSVLGVSQVTEGLGRLKRWFTTTGSRCEGQGGSQPQGSLGVQERTPLQEVVGDSIFTVTGLLSTAAKGMWSYASSEKPAEKNTKKIANTATPIASFMPDYSETPKRPVFGPSLSAGFGEFRQKKRISFYTNSFDDVNFTELMEVEEAQKTRQHIKSINYKNHHHSWLCFDCSKISSLILRDSPVINDDLSSSDLSGIEFGKSFVNDISTVNSVMMTNIPSADDEEWIPRQRLIRLFRKIHHEFGVVALLHHCRVQDLRLLVQVVLSPKESEYDHCRMIDTPDAASVTDTGATSVSLTQQQLDDIALYLKEKEFICTMSGVQNLSTILPIIHAKYFEDHQESFLYKKKDICVGSHTIDTGSAIGGIVFPQLTLKYRVPRKISSFVLSEIMGNLDRKYSSNNNSNSCGIMKNSADPHQATAKRNLLSTHCGSSLYSDITIGHLIEEVRSSVENSALILNLPTPFALEQDGCSQSPIISNVTLGTLLWFEKRKRREVKETLEKNSTCHAFVMPTSSFSPSSLTSSRSISHLPSITLPQIPHYVHNDVSTYPLSLTEKATVATIYTAIVRWVNAYIVISLRLVEVDVIDGSATAYGLRQRISAVRRVESDSLGNNVSHGHDNSNGCEGNTTSGDSSMDEETHF